MRMTRMMLTIIGAHDHDGDNDEDFMTMLCHVIMSCHVMSCHVIRIGLNRFESILPIECTTIASQ